MSRGPSVRAVLLLAMLAGMAGLLHRLGHGSLDVPLGSAADLQRWFDDTPPTTMAAALARAAGLLGCVYLVTVVALGVLADLAGWRPGARVATRLTPALIRRATRGGAHLGLWAGALAPTTQMATAALPQAQPPPTVTMAELYDEPTTAVATMVRLDDPAATVPHPVEPPVVPPPPPPDEGDRAPIPAPPPAVVPADTWVVARGDSFWSIAEDVVREAIGRAPSNDEVTPYWRDLISANRERLAAPDEPDLLLVGQELQLPAVG